MLARMNTYRDQPDEWIAATRAPSPLIAQDYLTINYTPGRGGRQPQAVILHVTQGESAGGCMNWFKNPRSQVSAQYVIDRGGTIYCAVRERDTAWANGVLNQPNMDLFLIERWVAGGINPNAETVSIECAGYSSQQPAGQPAELVGYSEAQFASLDLLLPALARRHDLTIDGDYCFGHCEIDSVNRADCPGLSDEEWARVYALEATTAGGPYATADEAYDAWCATWDDETVWAGQIVGKRHWYNRDPQELARTVGNRLLAYDGAYAQDASGYSLDEWQGTARSSGQLTIWGQETPPDPPDPQPEGPVGAAWPIEPGDGVSRPGPIITLRWGRDAPTADVRVYQPDGAAVFWADASAAPEVDINLPAGDYAWAVRGRDGERVSDWTEAHFAVTIEAPNPDPKPPTPPDMTPYPPVVTPTHQEQPQAQTWRNVHDGLVDLAVSRKWRPDCEGGAGPWPDTAQYLEDDYAGAATLVSPTELRALVRRLSIHPPIVEAAWRDGLWERVPATFAVDGSPWEDDAATDYGEDWSDMPAHAQTWATQICTLATAIQGAPTLIDAFVALGIAPADARTWSTSYHCLRVRARDLAQLAGC